VDCGRRWGKNVLGHDVAIPPLLDGYPVGWFSPTYKILVEDWDFFNTKLADIITRSNATERRIELLTGGVLEMWPVNDEDVGRSRAYKRVIIDEAAKIPRLKGAWENAIRPTLTDYAGDAWFMSTPKGRNYFWELWTRGQDDQSKTWKSWQFPTATNPYIAKSEIEEARHDTPEDIFKQEYLAEFIEGSGVVFRNVDAATTSPRVHRPDDHKHGKIYFGVDWGKQEDFTVSIAVCSECKQMVAFDRFNQIDYAFQRERLKAERDRWKPAGMMPERNSIGEPIIEQLIREGFPVMHGPDGKPGFFTSATSKPALIEDLALAIEKGELKIMDDPVLINELLAYERTPSKSGRPSYNAPEGLHDDCVMALALAWNAIQTGSFNVYTIG